MFFYSWLDFPSVGVNQQYSFVEVTYSFFFFLKHFNRQCNARPSVCNYSEKKKTCRSEKCWTKSTPLWARSPGRNHISHSWGLSCSILSRMLLYLLLWSCFTALCYSLLIFVTRCEQIVSLIQQKADLQVQLAGFRDAHLLQQKMEKMEQVCEVTGCNV